MGGYVYLIGSKRFGWYKIGKSRKPSVRVADLGIVLPFKVELLAMWLARDHSALESALHKLHAECRINGEWFSFDRGQLKAVLQSEHAEAFRVDGFARFQNVSDDIILDGSKEERAQKGRAFVAAMHEYMNSHGMEDTKDNRRTARKAVQEKFLTSR